jgi:hypothetical protein
MLIYLSALLLPLTFSGGATAPDPFATSIVSYTPGGGGGIFDADNLLGGPLGEGLGLGSLDVTTLGFGGEVVLGFDVVITDGPGADFLVFENGFVVSSTGAVFAEVARVAVSSDGVHFAEFPAFTVPGSAAMGAYRGLTGGMPVLANVATNSIDPRDPTVAGGEAFDLADLAGDPAVVAGTVDLGAISAVRLRDVLPGELDAAGNAIQDSGSGDFDAVCVVQHAGNQDAAHPIADLSYDASGRLVLTLGDPDGIADLDLATLRVSFNLGPLPITALLNALDVIAFDGNTVTLRSAVPLVGPSANTGLVGALSISTRDLSGAFAADQAMLQG